MACADTMQRNWRYQDCDERNLMRQQDAHTPARRSAQHQDESCTYTAARKIAFAPALEHGNHSNQEQHNSGTAQLQLCLPLSATWQHLPGTQVD